MTRDWNPYAPLAALDAQAEAQRQQQAQIREAERLRLRAALNHAAGRAWLDSMIERYDRAASYLPGASLDAVAWNESRRLMWRELRAELDAPKPATE